MPSIRPLTGVRTVTTSRTADAGTEGEILTNQKPGLRGESADPVFRIKMNVRKACHGTAGKIVFPAFPAVRAVTATNKAVELLHKMKK